MMKKIVEALYDSIDNAERSKAIGFSIVIALTLIENCELILFSLQPQIFSRYTLSLRWPTYNDLLSLGNFTPSTIQNLPICLLSASGGLFLLIASSLLLGTLKPSFGFIIKFSSQLYTSVFFIPLSSFLSYVFFASLSTSTLFFSVSGLLCLLAHEVYVASDMFMFTCTYNSMSYLRRNPMHFVHLRPACLSLAVVMKGLHVVIGVEFASYVGLLLVCAAQSIIIYQILCRLNYFEMAFVKWKLGITLSSAIFVLMQLLSKIAGSDSLLTRNFFVTYSIVNVGTLLLALNFRNYFVKGLVIETSDEINRDYIFQSKMRILERILVSEKNMKAKLMKSTIMQTHIKECTNVDCICKKKDEPFWDPLKKAFSTKKLQLRRDTLFSKLFLKMVFQQGVAKFSDSVLILTSYAYFLQDSVGLYMKACVVIRKLQLNFSHSLSKTALFLIFCLRKSIKLQLSSNYRKSHTSSFSDLSKLDSIKQNLYKSVDQVVQLLVYFWKTVSETIVDQNVLHETCDSIEEKKQVVIRLFTEYLAIDRNSKEIAALLNTYANFVVFNAGIEAEIMKGFKAHYQSQGLLIVNEELTCIVKATLDSEGHLPILWVSNNFEKLFGYGKQDAMGMSVKELMPASFAVPHGVAVEAWRQSGRETVMNSSRAVWAVDKTKVCFSCTLSLRPLLQDNQLQLLALLAKQNAIDFVLLDNKTWSLESAGSRLITEIFRVRPESLFEHGVELQAFSPQLLLLYHSNNASAEQQHTIHFLIPKNLEAYLATYQQLKHKTLQAFENLGKDDPQYAGAVDEYVAKSLQNLIVLAYQLQVIIQAKITMKQVTILTTSDHYKIRIIKLQQVKPLKQVPSFIQSLRDHAKSQIHLQIAYIKSQRHNSKQNVLDKVIKCFHFRRPRTRSVVDYLKLGMARKIKDGLLKDQQVHKNQKKMHSRETIEKVKRVLKEQGILGRNKFSVFNDGSCVVNQEKEELELPGQMLMLAVGQRQFQEQIEEALIGGDCQEPDSTEKQKSASGSSNQHIQIMIEQMNALNRRYRQTKPDRKILRINLFMLMLVLAYAICRGSTILFTKKTISDVKNLFQAQLSSAEMFRCVQSLSLLSISIFSSGFNIQVMNVTEYSTNCQQVNMYISKLLSEHLAQKEFKTIKGVEYYEYLNQKIILKTIDSQILMPFLSAARFYQSAASQMQYGDPLTQQFALYLLIMNRQMLKDLARNVTLYYHHSIKQQIFLFNTVLILLVVMRILLTLALGIVLFKTYHAKEKWTQMCSEALSSINIDASQRCIRYYKAIHFDQNRGLLVKHSKMEDNFSISKVKNRESRRPSIKGQISRNKLYVFIVSLVLYTTNQIITYTHLNISKDWNKLTEINVETLRAQSSLIDAMVRLKNDFFFSDTNLTRFQEQYGQTYQGFSDSIRDLFLYVPNQQSYMKSVLPILKSDLCDGYPTPVLTVLNSACATRDSNQYGLMMNAQLMAQETKKGYEVLAYEGFFPFVMILWNPNWAQAELTVLYLLNGCHLIARAIQDSVNYGVMYTLELGDIIIYVYLILILPLAWMFSSILKDLLKTIYKTKEYVFLVPSKIFCSNIYIKRFQSEFVKEYS